MPRSHTAVPARYLSIKSANVILVIQEVANMLAVRLNLDTERRLSHLARETGRSKSYYVRQAIEDFLENREDYLLGACRT